MIRPKPAGPPYLAANSIQTMLRPLLAFLLPAATLLATSCSTNNVTVDNSLQKYFDSAGVKGCFGLYDNGQGHFTIYNLARFRDSGYSPGATFDIFESLVAIQTGIVKDDASVIYDSANAATVKGTGPNPPATLRDCFQSQDERGYPAMILLSEKIGEDTLRKWIDSVHYGKRDPNKHILMSVTITPDEQMGLIKKLYFDQLPFFKRTQEIVRSMMTVESNSDYKLSYKRTSQGRTRDGSASGWVLGWIEENKHPYFFVLNMETSDGNRDVLYRKGPDIVKGILRQMGFFNGKK